MKLARRLACAIAVVSIPPFATLAACSSNDHPAPSGSSGGFDATSPSADGSQTTEAGADAPQGDAGDGGDADPYACPPVPGDPATATAVCKPTKKLGAKTQLSMSTSQDDQLASITPDELTILWYTGAGGVQPYYADRTLETDPFGARQLLASGIFLPTGMALAPTGLRAVVVAEDGKSFIELTRATRADFFGNPGAGDFATLNAALATDEMLADPVFGGDGLTFVYSKLGGSGAGSIYQSTRATTAAAWPAGSAIRGCDVDVVKYEYRRPIALSADSRTLFYFDYARKAERMAWRAAVNQPFSLFVTIGGGDLRAIPNAACTVAYSSSRADGGVGDDLFSSPLE